MSISSAKALVSMKTVPFSAVVEAFRRFPDWSGSFVPPVVVWELFGWREDEELPGILNLLDIEVKSGLFDGNKFLAGVISASTLISLKNKKILKSRLPDAYQLCLFPKLPPTISLVQKQAAYAFFCPVHEENTSECRPFRFYEIYFLYLLWHNSHIFDSVRLGKIRSGSVGEKIQVDVRNIIVSKVLPFFKADLTRLLDAVNSSGSFLGTWLSSTAVRHGASLSRLVGAASPCISKHYCSRIDAAFTLENEAILRKLAADVLSIDDLSILEVAAKGLPLTRIPRASELAKEVCVARVPFLRLHKKTLIEEKSQNSPRASGSPRHWEHMSHVDLPKKERPLLAEQSSVSERDSQLFTSPPKLPRAVDGTDYEHHWRRMLRAKATTGSQMRYAPHNGRNWFLSSIDP